MAAIKYRGPNAVTNFDISIYADRLNNISALNGMLQRQPPEELPAEENEKNKNKKKKQKQQEPALQEEKEEKINLQPVHDLSPSVMALEMEVMESLLPPVPDIVSEEAGRLPELLEDGGFEDIETLIGALTDDDDDGDEGLEFDPDSLFNAAADVVAGAEEEEEKKREGYASPPRPFPSSSTITLVSCN